MHAQGQVAIFVTDFLFDVEKLKWIFNSKLPSSIRIGLVEQVPAIFHPRFDVVQKTYFYHFFVTAPLPWFARYGYHLATSVDLDLLRHHLQVFVGTHDFRSFCSGSEIKNTVRTIDSIDLVFNDHLNSYKIIFKGKGFLRYMIRRIVGACFYSVQKGFNSQFLVEVLNQKNPNQRLPTAPAQGLMLYEISY